MRPQRDGLAGVPPGVEEIHHRNRPVARRWVWPALGVYCAALYLVWHGDVFRNPYLVNDDAGQHIFWMYRWLPGSGFVGDDAILALAELLQPWGIVVLYRALTFFLDPLLITRLLPLLLLTLTAAYLLLLLRDHVPLGLAAAGVVLVTTHVQLLGWMAGGHAKTFATPLLIACLYYLSRRKYAAVSGCVLAASLLYPPVFLTMCGVCLAVPLLKGDLRRGDDGRRVVVPVVASMVLGAALIAVKGSQITRAEIAGPYHSRSEILTLPEFGSEGRIAFAPLLRASPAYVVLRSMEEAVPPIANLRIPSRLEPAGSVVHGLVLRISLIALLALWLVGLVRRHRLGELDRIVIALMLTGLLLFLAARAVAPLLYIPSRYLRSAPLIASLLIVICLHRMAPRASRGLVLLLALSLPLLLLSVRRIGLTDYSRLRAVYERVEALDAPVMIAAPFRVCDQIPLFTHRSCLVSYEASHAVYFRNYAAMIRERSRELLAAYYARDEDSVRAFAERFRVDYIVVDRDFHASGGPTYFEPIRSMESELRRTADGAPSALLDLARREGIPIDERFILVDTRGRSPVAGAPAR